MSWYEEKDSVVFRNKLRVWDMKLSRLNDEMLWYVFQRAGSIINSREAKRVKKG